MTIRKFATTLLTVAGILVLVTACGSPSKPPAITGTAIYMLNVPLPPDAIVEVKWVKTTAAGEVTEVLDTLSLQGIRKAPIPFEIPYNRSGIHSSTHYAVTCEIRSGSRVLFRTPRPVPVLTYRSPNNVEVLLETVR